MLQLHYHMPTNDFLSSGKNWRPAIECGSSLCTKSFSLEDGVIWYYDNAGVLCYGVFCSFACALHMMHPMQLNQA